MEREIVLVLQFKLLPDTLYFWLDLQVRLWDLFVDLDSQAARVGCRHFKPTKDSQGPHLSRYDPKLSTLQLGKANTYRVLVQALDLMSLHFGIHGFSRSKLTLSLLALVQMEQLGIFRFQGCLDTGALSDEVSYWIDPANGLQKENEAFETFKRFLKEYCKEMLPENFLFDEWPTLLGNEMLFACQFLTWAPQYFEPQPRKKRVVVDVAT